MTRKALYLYTLCLFFLAAGYPAGAAFAQPANDLCPDAEVLAPQSGVPAMAEGSTRS